ncbi:protein of unknown function [Legionella micdadei]|uniref:Uncharacterized protein n=1 Tax=Legionella micdadei TaxID=451 RepID=A0A098GFP1_LEGMI|nr:protein of unknown function [Legionella micdadei]
MFCVSHTQQHLGPIQYYLLYTPRLACGVSDSPEQIKFQLSYYHFFNQVNNPVLQL